jgi:hypothetical protein
MQLWQFRSTPMRSGILATISMLKIAWEAWRFARGDGNAIGRRGTEAGVVRTGCPDRGGAGHPKGIQLGRIPTPRTPTTPAGSKRQEWRVRCT